MTECKWFAVACLALAAGCTTNPSSTTTTLSEFSGSYTLQGKVMSATDGSPITTGLTLNLVQGKTIRNDYSLQTTGALAGDYAFSNIPLPIACGDITYQLAASATGFEPFQATLNYCVTPNDPYNEIDSTYNFIGNVYLFPLGATAPNYTFHVTYQGAPVANATVLLDPVNPVNYDAESNALSNDLGVTASLSGTTDNNGNVVFAGTTLALGASYQVQVLPVQFTPNGGTAISLAGCGASGATCPGLASAVVQVGIPGNPVNQSIALTGLAQPLYIASDSAQPQGTITASGQLVITFNTPVTLVGTFAAAGVNTATVLTPVTATLSNGGLTLTLAPATGTITCTNTTQACGITYSDGTALVSPVEYPAQTSAVFSTLKLAGNVTPASTVFMVGP